MIYKACYFYNPKLESAVVKLEDGRNVIIELDTKFIAIPNPVLEYYIALLLSQ